MARKIGIALALATASFFVGCVILAKRDALDAVSTSSGATAKFESFAPSKTYGIYFTFKVDHHPEIQRVYWRLIPFRHAEVEK